MPPNAARSHRPQPTAGWMDAVPANLLSDRSSQPHHCPHQLTRCRDRRIIELRLIRRWGPHHIGVARSTVGRVLARYNIPTLDCIA